MKNKIKQYAIIILCLTVISIKAQKEELECKKFEEGLYLNSMLNKPFSPQRFIDSITGCMGESSKIHLTLGKYYYNNDDYANAEKEYKKVINNNRASKKEMAEAYYYLSLSAYYTYQYEQCIKYSNSAIDNGYYSVWVNDNIGLSLSNMGKQEESIVYFEKALKTDPAYSSALNNIGVSYYRMKKHDIALKYYYKADSVSNNEKALYVSNIFRSLREQKRDAEAEAYLKKLYPKFMNNKYIIADYVRVLKKEKKYDEILKSARRLYNMHPDNSTDWFEVGYAYFDGGQLDSAFYAYNIALKYNPKNVHAYANITQIYNLVGMYKESNAKLDIAFAVDSNYWYFYERKYTINIWQHNFEEARKWVMLLKARFPEEKNFDFELGWALLHMKKYEEAIMCFKKELKKAPKDDRLLNNLGRCYTGLKQTDTAMAYFNRAMSINPENSYIYHNRGALYCYMGKLDLACADLKTAIDKEYNWIIDEDLEKMHQKHCPDVNTNRKIIIHEYKGNKAQFSRYNFIKLNDSLLNNMVADQILKDLSTPSIKEEKDTRSVFDSFKIYPNPNQGTFYVESMIESQEPLTIKIYNESGALVLTDKMHTAKKQISLKEPTPGIYVVMISNSSSVLSVKKVIIYN